MKNSLIYVVEDNKVYNKMVAGYFNKHGFSNLKSFYSSNDCIREVKNGEHPEVIIQDYYMEELNGIEVLKKVKKISPNTEFIFLTGNESTEVAVNSIKYGAFDYIIKDEVALDKAKDKVQKILNVKQLKRKNKAIKKYMTVTVLVIAVIVLCSILWFVFDVFNFQ